MKNDERVQRKCPDNKFSLSSFVCHNSRYFIKLFILSYFGQWCSLQYSIVQCGQLLTSSLHSSTSSLSQPSRHSSAHSPHSSCTLRGLRLSYLFKKLLASFLFIWMLPVMKRVGNQKFRLKFVVDVTVLLSGCFYRTVDQECRQQKNIRFTLRKQSSIVSISWHNLLMQ